MGIHAAVAVLAEVDPGDHAASDGDAISADGIADGDDLGIEFGDAAKAERGEVFKVLAVHRFEDGEVAIVGDEDDAGGVGFWVVGGAEDEFGGVADDVSVGEEAVFADEEASAGAASGAAAVPRLAVVRHLHGGIDVDDAIPDIGSGVDGLGLNQPGKSRKNSGREEGKCGIHGRDMKRYKLRQPSRLRSSASIPNSKSRNQRLRAAEICVKSLLV